MIILNQDKKNSKKNESASVLGQCWAIFALFLIFSLWTTTRINFNNISIHIAFFLIPIILLMALPFGLISLKGFKKYFLLSLLFLSIMFLSWLVNGNFNQILFIKWISVFLTILLTVATVKNKKDIIVILKSMVIAVTFICLYGLIGYFKNNKFYVNPFMFATKNSLSNWTSSIYPIVLFLFIYFSKKNINKIFWASSFLIIALSQILTLNRSSWVIIILSIFSVFLIFKEKKKIIFCCLILIILFCFITNANPLTINKAEERLQILKDNSLLGRFEQVKKTLVIFRQKPLLGVGPGSYVEYDTGIQLKNKFSFATHSIYLTILSEFGLLGFITLSFIILFIIFSLKKSFYKTKNKENQYLALVLLLSILMILIRGLTSHEIQFVPITLLVVGLAIKLPILINSEIKNNL